MGEIGWRDAFTLPVHVLRSRLCSAHRSEQETNHGAGHLELLSTVNRACGGFSRRLQEVWGRVLLKEVEFLHEQSSSRVDFSPFFLHAWQAPTIVRRCFR